MTKDELTQSVEEKDALSVIAALRRESDAQLIAFLSSDDPRAQAIKDVTDGMAAYPYGKEARELFGKDGIITNELYLQAEQEPFTDGGGINGIACFLDVVNVYRGATEPIKEQAEKLTGGGTKRLTEIIDRVQADTNAVIDALDGGRWKTLEGEAWPRDHYGLADISAFLPPTITEHYHESRKLKSSEITDHQIAKRNSTVSVRDMDVCIDTGAISHLVAVPKDRTETGGEIVLPYASLMGLDVSFAFLCNLDTAGYTKALKELLTQPQEVEAELLPLARVQGKESFYNHGFISKALRGITAIAYGEPEYILTPSGGKSKEVYSLRASEKTCSDFLKAGGNDELLLKVIDTVFQIIKDPQAEKYRVGNRLCISTNTITQELSRTQGGAIEARKYDGIRRTVNAALLVATDGRIIATDAAGKLKGTMRLLKGDYREAYTYRGRTYKDVWIFDVSAEMMDAYSEEQGHTYRYPLLNMERPLNLTESWIDGYLKDALNEARHALYQSDGKKRSQKKKTIKRSWPELFEKGAVFSSDGAKKELTSRQKQSLVNGFQTILEVLADMDAHGQLREGRPLYIKAYSERNPSRGRGRGEWKNLVIEASSSFHTPNIDLS